MRNEFLVDLVDQRAMIVPKMGSSLSHYIRGASILKSNSALQIQKWTIKCDFNRL